MNTTQSEAAIRSEAATKSEAAIQSKCVIWFHNAFPEYRGLLFSINNNSEHVVRAMNRKSMGLVPGVADTCLFLQGDAYFIEFKTESGKQSPAQREWQTKIVNQMGQYFICRTFEQFTIIIHNILTRIPNSRASGMIYSEFFVKFCNI